MIDTVKLTVPYQSRPDWIGELNKNAKLNTNTGKYTATIYPSKSYIRQGIYLPKVWYEDYPIKDGRKYSLNIELSLPKLYFGNNYDELTNDLLSAIVIKLSKTLYTVYGIWVTPSEIEQSVVGRIDYSKNIPFTDFTLVSTITNALKLADIQKTYDLQENLFRNGGHIYHIHTNSQDIAMYDKVADLKQAKVSEKRAYSKVNYSQLNLIDELEKHKSLTVARYEIRLNGMRKIRKELKAVNAEEDLRLCTLFSSDISKKILLHHWQNILDRIPKSEVGANTTTQVLISFKRAYPDMKFAEASALTLMQLLRTEARDERAVRNVIEGLFGTPQYYRLKKRTHKPSTKTQLACLLYITEIVTAMKPVRIKDYIQ